MQTIGEKIEEIRVKRGINKAEFARRINKSRQTVEDIIKRESIDTELLAAVSQILEYNFFVYLAHNSELMFDERGTNDYGFQLNAYPVNIETSEYKEKYFSLMEKYTAVLEENKKLASNNP